METTKPTQGADRRDKADEAVRRFTPDQREELPTGGGDALLQSLLWGADATPGAVVTGGGEAMANGTTPSDR